MQAKTRLKRNCRLHYVQNVARNQQKFQPFVQCLTATTTRLIILQVYVRKNWFTRSIERDTNTIFFFGERLLWTLECETIV